MTVESLGEQLRQLLPRRLHSLSLCDHEANVRWLSEGALGPDEHGLVVDALEVLSTDTSLPCHEIGLEDARLAFFLPVRSPTADLVGIVMIIADSKSLGDDTLERLTAAPMRAIMLRLAVLLKPAGKTATVATVSLPADEMPDILDGIEAAASPAAASPRAAGNMSPEEVNDILELDLTPDERAPPPPLRDIPVARPAASARAAPGRAAEPPPEEMLSLEYMADTRAAPPPRPAARAPAPPAPAATPASAAALASAAAPVRAAAPAPVTAPPVRAAARVGASAAAAVPPARVAATPQHTGAQSAFAASSPAPAAAPAAASPATGDVNLVLELLPFAKLRAGGQTRRFQVLGRMSPPHRDPAAQDALVLQRVMSWLAAHRAAWNSQPTGFTVNLSIATLEDERFAQKLGTALNSHGIGGDTFGFEITEALCTQRRAQVERFISQCEKVGSWVVIDDFSFDSQVMPLLRSKAVRLVKIDAKVSSSALKDKLSQAMVVATVQAAKVLGIHCAAKRVDSQAALQWLTAIGCDFAQGAALAGIQTLDSLASSPDPTGLCPVLRPT
jgi:EAL domain-containing protein (putative c-di-GMP-specific phosphodiesterase class I)